MIAHASEAIYAGAKHGASVRLFSWGNAVLFCARAF